MRYLLGAQVTTMLAYLTLCLAQVNLTDFGDSCDLDVDFSANQSDVQQASDLGTPTLCPPPTSGSIPIRLYRQGGVKMRVVTASYATSY